MRNKSTRNESEEGGKLYDWASRNVNSFNSFDSLNVSGNLNVTTPDEGSEILMWLSPLEPRLRHQDIRNRRIENVGHWLLDTEQLRSWFQRRI
ncbi:hypothetical protein L873DRAFT_297380 [Choiromyces venosus 120613-1]|uniref:Uncharacterized protein n=1 Tax=Choiromyces venosus 120613-1 TaxID=1336337 RepID=A0A3N4J4R6_9PEZI|nr:hypothetical protein L873DRAFT_297380 [Choiromyces venosus 120613-1]